MTPRALRYVPASVAVLWGLETILVVRLLGRSRTVVESLPSFIAEVFFAYFALGVYGWLLALIVAGRRVLAAAANGVLIVFYAALVLYHWHSGGHFDWSVIWSFHRELLDPAVLGMVSSLLGWRSVLFLAAVVLGTLGLGMRGALGRFAVPRHRGAGVTILAAVAAFLLFGPLRPDDEITASLRAARAYVALARMMPRNGGDRRFPYLQRPDASVRAGADRPSVFIVAVESFNAHFVETRTPDGREYTPFYNSLIPRGMYVENFHGNSMETWRGHFALLCSVWPSIRPAPLRSYEGLHIHSLATILKEQGYETIFYQAATSLEFEGTGAFMRDKGFSVVRVAGEKEGMHRADGRAWGFGVQDDVLFEEFFAALDERERTRSDHRPYFGLLATISSHFPDSRIPLDQRYLFTGAIGGRAGYGNAIYLADSYLRAFFRELSARSYLRNSIVVITGDHSYPAAEHGSTDSEFGCYEELFRTPILILWDGRLAPRRIQGELWSQIDVAPTILDLLGIGAANHFLGHSMLRGFDPTRDRVHLSQPYDGIYLAALGGNLKYVLHVSTAEELLFDLARDPHEDVNVIGQYRKSKELRDLRHEVGRMLLNQRLIEEDRIWPHAAEKP